MGISKLEENNLQEIKKSYYNSIVYCYVEEQKDELEEFISKYNDTDIIHIISSVIESCDGKLLYCLCDIITNYIETSKENDTRFCFVTDIKELYDIVKKIYSAIFEDIIYIEQSNNKQFDKEFETDEFINYFLNIQRSKLNSSFMRQLWELKNCQDKSSFMKFLYELRGLGIENEDYLKRLWHCLCEILLYESGYNEVKNSGFIYKLAIYSILMALDKNVDYANIYLSEILKSDEINAENMYFVYHQFKRMFFTRQAILDKQSQTLLNELYDKCYDSFIDRLKNYIVKMSFNERDKHTVMIMAVQFLDSTHAPTKTVIERIKVLKKLGKKVILVNTAEICLMDGYLPIYMIDGASYFEKYDTINKIEVDGEWVTFVQIPKKLPVPGKMQMLINIINKIKPYYILSIGNGSILADLCGNIVPCASMSVVFSSIPKTKNNMKIIGRKLKEDEKKLYIDDDIIESRFTFELKEQKLCYSKTDKNLPDNKFIIVVIGTRLQFDVTDEFMKMLQEVCKKGCYVVFAGIMDNYDSLMENYPIISDNSSFIGYCDDILALMEICDLYVNPDRLGGGFSVIEAFYKGKPGVYLNKGDVYIAGGENFAVGSFDEMEEQILKYKSDRAYYTYMSELAKERAKFMTSSKEAIEDIDRQICQKIKEKYW